MKNNTKLAESLFSMGEKTKSQIIYIHLCMHTFFIENHMIDILAERFKEKCASAKRFWKALQTGIESAFYSARLNESKKFENEQIYT